jgi:DNA-binding NtrC family response regulator
MTGHADLDETRHETLPSSYECLQKPFHRDTLIRRVRQTLDVVEMQPTA